MWGGHLESWQEGGEEGVGIVEWLDCEESGCFYRMVQAEDGSAPTISAINNHILCHGRSTILGPCHTLCFSNNGVPGGPLARDTSSFLWSI
jgi:hypothetical protein